MSSRPSTRPGLRRPDFGPMQHRSFRTMSLETQQQQQRVIRRRTIVDGSLTHALEQSSLSTSSSNSNSNSQQSIQQTRSFSLIGNELNRLQSSISNNSYRSTSASGINIGQPTLSLASNGPNSEDIHDQPHTDLTWGITTASVTSTIPGSVTMTGQAPTMDDTLQDPFAPTGSAPATPRRSLPRTPRRRSQTPGNTTPRRSSLRAMAESSELMRRRSIVESQRQVKISRDKHSPMNIIRMLTRVPGFVPAPRPSSGRGPIPGSENWRKLTPKSAKTRNFPLGDGEVDIRPPGEESSRSSSAVKNRLSNPFLATDQQDGEGGDVRDDLRHRDLTDVSMEYKLGSGGDDETNRRGDEGFEAGDALDDRYLVSTPGLNATEEGEAVAEDPFDMQMEESRRERSLLVSEGDQTGEMSIGRLSQILGEKAVLNEEEADSQIPLDQDMEGERNMHDQALQGYDQQGQEEEAAFPEDGAEWNDIPEGADVQGDTAISEVEANSGEIAEVSGEEQRMEAQSEEYPQAEGEEPQDQNEDESGWQDVEEQEGNHNRRDNQTLFLDDLPSELGMLSNGQFLPVDAPKGKKNVRMSKNGLPVPSLPASLQRQLVHTFARTKMSREAMEEITEASHLFFEQVSGDLAAYAAHAGRRTIDDSDVECLMRRLRLTNSKVSLESLLHRYLPRELRDLVLYPKELRPPGQR